MKTFFYFLFILSFSANLYGRPAPESFADLVEDLIPAVVTVVSSAKASNQQEQMIPQFPEGSPFDEFFKEYFDRQNRESPSQKPLVGLGSGFIVEDSGIIVTNNHVIEMADEIKIIMFDQTEYTAKLLGRDPKADLAVLKFDPGDKKLKATTWGNSDITRVGDWAIAIGNPLGIGGTVTAGIVSAISRDIGAGPYVKFIQTDASINRGNSGGPLFNVDGEVIGINSAIISQSGGSIGLGFAIPSNSAKKIIYQLKEFGRTKRGFLGVEITNVTDEIAESLGLPDKSGAFVSSLNPNGPAKTSGIQEGDVILSFNNVKILKMSDLPRLVAETDIGSVSKVEVWRKNKKIVIEVKLGELPEKSYVNRTDEIVNIDERKIDSLNISIAPTSTNKGVIITKVNENTKLSVGDTITEVNREKITTVDNFIELVNTINKTGRMSLLLRIIRDDQSLWVTVKFKN